MELRKKGEESGPVLSEVSVGMGHEIVHFIGTMARESTMDMMSAPKKISRVSPCFLHLKILKEPFWAT
jgi:hypothetical protein